MAKPDGYKTEITYNGKNIEEAEFPIKYNWSGETVTTTLNFKVDEVEGYSPFDYFDDETYTLIYSNGGLWYRFIYWICSKMNDCIKRKTFKATGRFIK